MLQKTCSRRSSWRNCFIFFFPSRHCTGLYPQAVQRELIKKKKNLYFGSLLVTCEMLSLFKLLSFVWCAELGVGNLAALGFPCYSLSEPIHNISLRIYVQIEQSWTHWLPTRDCCFFLPGGVNDCTRKTKHTLASDTFSAGWTLG